MKASIPAAILKLGNSLVKVISIKLGGITKLMPTFHPSYLLRQYTVENRRIVYEDLQQVKAALDAAD